MVTKNISTITTTNSLLDNIDKNINNTDSQLSKINKLLIFIDKNISDIKIM